MKQTLTLIVIASACLIAAGCVSTQSIKVAPPPPQLSQADQRSLVACLGPVRLPKGELTMREVERLWISDRHALLDCGKRHKALRDFYTERDMALVQK